MACVNWIKWIIILLSYILNDLHCFGINIDNDCKDNGRICTYTCAYKCADSVIY
jgi:hypothetical protein